MFSVIYKKVFLAITAIIFVTSFLIIAVFGLEYSIDFTGGALTEVLYTTVPDKTALEDSLSELNLGGISIRETASDGEGGGYFVRTRDLTEDERKLITSIVTTVGEGGEVVRFTTVGPTIGAELSSKALWAIGFVSLIIILYVAYAFAGIGKPVSAWIYGIITIFVLFHDVLVPTAMMSLLGHFTGAEVDVLFVMAILAVLGYSVNDTIVIFDRVRENLKANRTEERTKVVEPGGIEQEIVTYTLTKPFADIVGPAVTETLGRSINTSLTTLLALTTLYVFGGELTQNFALVLMAGVLAGTYSSICMAVPLLVAYADWQAKRPIVEVKSNMLIGIVGALGAGKGTVVEYLIGKGYKHYSGSGYLKEVLLERGDEINRDAYSRIAGEIRTKDPQGLAKILYSRYVTNGEGDAVIEALHDIGEVEFIKSAKGIVLAIDAPMETRYQRAVARGSEKDNITFEHFKIQIDREENGGGHHNIRAAMQLADHTIMNDGTIEELQTKIEDFLTIHKL